MLGLLCNPTSGGGRGGKIKEQVISHLQSQELDFLDLSGVNADAAKMNLKALDLERISNLIVIGGDGLVHLAIQKLAK